MSLAFDIRIYIAWGELGALNVRSPALVLLIQRNMSLVPCEDRVDPVNNEIDHAVVFTSGAVNANMKLLSS